VVIVKWGISLLWTLNLECSVCYSMGDCYYGTVIDWHAHFYPFGMKLLSTIFF